MKIVFTSSHETYSKENTKNYTPNSYVLVFVMCDLIFFCLQFETEDLSKPNHTSLVHHLKGARGNKI